MRDMRPNARFSGVFCEFKLNGTYGMVAHAATKLRRKCRGSVFFLVRPLAGGLNGIGARDAVRLSGNRRCLEHGQTKSAMSH